MKALIYLIIFLMSGVWFASCRSTQYVPVETIKTEVQYKDRLQRDSIHVLDSVFMLVKGDTVFRDRYRIEYRDKLIRDTTYIHKTDSVQVPYPVEKKLSRWQSIKMELGGWALGIIIVFGLVIIGWMVYRIRKK
ncbi:hypothetical protein [Bacteroides sp.]|uniref:hypothetical protein n=1 Tax=Bacteroides sp. TaxID=29523 RepID=UPI002627E980|nr:hypothetical protein [Bacteroides sp.]MDD3038598.1 hypothetical protein [Bacteroides sp.]